MFETIINSAFVLFSVYLIASMSGLFAERSGTINLSINGGMVIGALFYYLAAKGIIQDGDLQFMWRMNLGAMFIGIISGTIASIVLTSLLSFAAINLKGNQIVVGTAINILAPVLSLILVMKVFNPGGQIDGSSTVFGVQASAIGQESSLEYWQISMMVAIAALALVGLLWLLLNKSKLGLRLRSAGENPHALAAAGVSVFRIRHIGMLISGALAGLAGTLMAAFSPTLTTFGNNVGGAGYIAIAILIIGQWRTQYVILGAAVFSVMFSYIDYYAGELAEYKFLLKTVPYVATIALLPFVSRFSRAPKAEGIPYSNAGR